MVICVAITLRMAGTGRAAPAVHPRRSSRASRLHSALHHLYLSFVVPACPSLNLNRLTAAQLSAAVDSFENIVHHETKRRVTPHGLEESQCSGGGPNELELVFFHPAVMKHCSAFASIGQCAVNKSAIYVLVAIQGYRFVLKCTVLNPGHTLSLARRR